MASHLPCSSLTARAVIAAQLKLFIQSVTEILRENVGKCWFRLPVAQHLLDYLWTLVYKRSVNAVEGSAY